MFRKQSNMQTKEYNFPLRTHFEQDIKIIRVDEQERRPILSAFRQQRVVRCLHDMHIPKVL